MAETNLNMKNDAKQKMIPPPKESSTEMLVSPPTKQKLHRIHRQLVGTLHLLVFLVFQFRVSNSSCPHAELKRCNSHPLTVTLFMHICPILRLKYQQKSILFFFSRPTNSAKNFVQIQIFCLKAWKKIFLKMFQKRPQKAAETFSGRTIWITPGAGRIPSTPRQREDAISTEVGGEGGNGGNVGGLWDVKGWKMGLKHSKKIYHILN